MFGGQATRLFHHEMTNSYQSAPPKSTSSILTASISSFAGDGNCAMLTVPRPTRFVTCIFWGSCGWNAGFKPTNSVLTLLVQLGDQALPFTKIFLPGRAPVSCSNHSLLPLTLT